MTPNKQWNMQKKNYLKEIKCNYSKYWNNFCKLYRGKIWNY